MNEIIVDKMTDEEMLVFAGITNNILTQVCIFADKYNYDRDNILAYLASRLYTLSEIATIKEFNWSEKI